MFKKLLVMLKHWLGKPARHHELLKFSLFTELNDHELHLVHNSLQYREFKAGEVIFEAGFPVEVLYFIASGELQLTGLGEDSSIMVLNKHQCLGILDLFAKNKRLGTAKAVTELQVMTLPQTDFWEMVHKNPVMGVKLLSACSKLLAKHITEPQ